MFRFVCIVVCVYSERDDYVFLDDQYQISYNTQVEPQTLSDEMHISSMSPQVGSLELQGSIITMCITMAVGRLN